MPYIRSTFTAISLLGFVALAGCSAKYDQDFFDYDREQSRTRRIFEASYAKAAAQDAALRPGHFDETASGPKLNGLGRERLDLMLKARSPGELLQVWIDVPGDMDEAIAQMMLEVADDYLSTAGLDRSAYVIAVGPSPVDNRTDRSLAAMGTESVSAPAPGIFGDSQ